MEHRGYKLQQHGRRWRTMLRINGDRQVVARDSIDELRAALDAVLDAAEDQRSYLQKTERVHLLGAGHMTVKEMVEAWFAWKTGPRSDEPIRARTRRDYRRSIDKFILPLIGTLDAATVTTNELKKEFFRVCPSRTYARFSRTVLQQAFRWGIEEQLVGRRDNPCVGIMIAKRDARDGRNRKLTYIRAVTDDEIPSSEEVQKMLAWSLETGRTIWWLWVYIVARLGLRPSEANALQVEDFDVANSVVRIRRSAPDRSDPADWDLKTDTSARDLRVDAEFFAEILPHLPSDGWLFEARARGGGRPQRTHTATPCWPADAPNREMRRMRRALGLSETYTPYSLRHFVATRLILAGKEDIQVAKWLGTSVQMLHKVYANHLDPHAQRDIGSAVMDLF